MEFPILAADDIVGVIVGVIFLLISAASAISNVAKEKNKPQPGKVKEKAALQKELEKFLQDAMNPQGAKKEKPAEIDFFEEEIPEKTTVQQPPQRRRRQRKTSQQQGRRNQQARKKANTKPENQVSQIERSELPSEEQSSRLGSSMRERIEKRQKKHLQSSINDHLDGNVNRHVTETFGSREMASNQASSSKRGGSRLIRELLRDRQSFKQAIILNEILSPPLSRRRS